MMTEEDVAAKKSKTKRILVLMVLVIIGGAVLRLYGEFGGSSEGTITTKGSVASPQPAAPVIVEGRYARFAIPAVFDPVQADPAAPPVLERYNFFKQQIGSWQIAIQVTRLASGQLSDDGTYNFRNVTGERFEREDRQVGTNKATIFSDKTAVGFSKVAYLQKGSLGASLSVMSGTAGNTSELQQELDALIASWQWR